MKKIRLELDALEVESFETVEEDGAARGTVHAHTGAGWESCGPTYCDGYTCWLGSCHPHLECIPPYTDWCHTLDC